MKRSPASSSLTRARSFFVASSSIGLDAVVRERCRSGNLKIEDALDLFDRMLSAAENPKENEKPSIYSFNLLFTAVARMKPCNQSPTTLISLYNRTNRIPEISPDSFTYGIFIHSCCRANRVDLGLAIFGSMLKRAGFSSGGNTVILNSLITGFCTEKRIGEAVELLDRMPRLGCSPDVISYNILIKALCSAKRISDAAELLDRMPHLGCTPDVVSYSILIEGLCMEKRVDEAAELLGRMPRLGCSPNIVSYNTLIKGLCSAGNTDSALELLREMATAEGVHYKPDVVTYSTVIDALCRKDAVDEASLMLQEMIRVGIDPDVITYTSIIRCHSVLGHWEDATGVIRQMVDRGILPNAVTFMTLMDSLCVHNRTYEAHRLFDVLMKHIDFLM